MQSLSETFSTRVRVGGRDHVEVGTKLVQTAFTPTSGPLADSEAEAGERVATMELFKGAMGVFKNPSSHRPVDYDDPAEVAEILLFADLLHRMLDRVDQRRDGKLEISATPPVSA